MLAPERVAALLTIASSPCFVRKPGWQTAMLPSLLENFSAELAEDFERTLNRFLSLQVRGSEHASAVLKTLRTTLLAQGAPQPAALAAGLEMLHATDLRPGMQAIDCPMLVIMGERDTLVPVNAGRETLDLCHDARLEVIDGAGHAPFLAAPETVADRINRFLL
jgi:pimeloyl-[acyl-carrier protein] methyl ester esterase